MTIWTRESLLSYRRDRRWPELEPGVCDEAVGILNDAHDAMRRVRRLADIEPATGFSVGMTEGGHE